MADFITLLAFYFGVSTIAVVKSQFLLMIVFFFGVSLFNRAKGFLIRLFFTGPLRRILKEDSNLFRQVHLFRFLVFPIRSNANFQRKKVIVAV
jgi:hypothetical protein